MKAKSILPVLLLALFGSLLSAQEKYNNCGRYGNAKAERIRKVNFDKNRYELPSSSDIDHAITLDRILEEGDDENRFTNAQAAEVVGYVFAVKKGGIETCNCKAKKDRYRDTHIELTLDADKTGKTQRMIIEITPRMRAKMEAKNVDWSTSALKKAILHKWVKVTGWMLFDSEHWQNAENTNPDGDEIWRGTAWEIHPITGIDVVEQP